MNYNMNIPMFIDLAVKTLALKPELVKDVGSYDELIDRVIDFSRQFAEKIPLGPPHV